MFFSVQISDVGPDHLGPPVQVRKTWFNSDQLGS